MTEQHHYQPEGYAMTRDELAEKVRELDRRVEALEAWSRGRPIDPKELVQAAAMALRALFNPTTEEK